MSTIFTFVGSPGTIGAANGGKVTGVVVGVSGQQVVGANPGRQSITFHNPDSSNILVYPMVNASGGANLPSIAAPAGGFILFPGNSFTVAGECQGAWGALGVNASNYLTIMESNT